MLALMSMSAHAHNGNHYSSNVLRVYTEDDFAPYTYLNENGKLEGIAIDIVNRILEDAKFKHTSPKTMPWARSYYLTQHQPNTLLFAMYRTPIRENLFEWVGPIGNSKIVMFVKKGRDFDPENFKIAAVRESASYQAVMKKGIDPNRIVPLNDNNLGVMLLNVGRVDAWAVSHVNAMEKIKENNFKLDDFYIYEVISERDLYLGFNKETNHEILDFFTEKLEELRKSGFIDKTNAKFNH
jgi:polar amino acid transport system substrate-binding protein